MTDDIIARQRTISARLSELYRESQESLVDDHGSKNRSDWTFKNWPCVNFDEMYDLAGELFLMVKLVQNRESND